MRDQGRTENARGFFLHIIDGFHHLDAAGLAAPAGMDLGLYHPNRTAQLLSALDRFSHAEGGNAAWHRHAKFAQHRLRLILVNIHGVTLELVSRVYPEPLQILSVENLNSPD